MNNNNENIYDYKEISECFNENFGTIKNQLADKVNRKSRNNQ